MLAVITVLLALAVLCTQFNFFLQTEPAAVTAAVLVVLTLGGGVVFLGGTAAPLALFSLLLAVHTMLPVSELLSIGLAASLTVLYMTWSICSRDYFYPEFWKQVG